MSPSNPAAAATPTVKKGRKPSCKHPIGDKKCGLAVGHPGDHKPRVVTKRDLTGLDETMLEMRAPTAQISESTAPARARDPRQQAIDKAVADLHTKWKNGSKERQWAKIPATEKGMYLVPPNRAELVRAMVRSAGEFHKLSIRFGTPARVGPRLPDGKPNPDAGKEIIVFVAITRRTNEESGNQART